MSDRKPDDSLPHRSLAGTRPQENQPGEPASNGARSRGSNGTRDRTPSGSGSATSSSTGGGGNGPSTAAMPRVSASGPTTSGAATATATAPGRAAAIREKVEKPPKPKRERRPVRTRRARLRVIRVDPWSVMKLSFALSIAVAIVTVVAVAIVWSVLGAAGVWDSINSSVASVLQNDTNNFDVTNYVGIDRIMGFTLVIAAADIVLVTAIATLGAFLYNLSASLLGGLEVTLAEDL